jgi:multidrug efflux pump subunit AcrA (membrane-fusion protein)
MADTILPNHSTVGMVKNLRDEMPVSAPHGGIVVEWLVDDGDPVSPGQPLLRLHPIVESADATEVRDDAQVHLSQILRHVDWWLSARQWSTTQRLHDDRLHRRMDPH